MNESRNGWTESRHSAARENWRHAFPPFGMRGPDLPASRRGAAARMSIEGSQLAVAPDGLTAMLDAICVGWCTLVWSMSLLVIGLVAAYDTYLSVKFQEALPILEMNPLCRMIIAADGGSVAMLLGFKFAGTVLALGAILLLYRFKPSIGVAVAVIVAGLQGTLFLYLFLG